MAPMNLPYDALREVGEEIRQARMKRNISLRKFSVQMDLSSSYYSKIERGEVLAATETYEMLFTELGLDRMKLLPKVGLIDSDTQKMVLEKYKANSQAFAGHLRKFTAPAPKKR